MPKYYVRDGYERGIVDAKTPEEAICFCVLRRFDSFVVNGFYIVSEVGFEQHDDDLIYESNLILDIIADKYGDDFRENPKKDEDWY